MSRKDESDSDGAPEYEDDFEKDLDWLINEDAEKNKGSQSQEEESSDLKLDPRNSVEEQNESDKSSGNNNETVHVEPSTNNKPTLDSVSECEETDNEDEEAKRYIAEKIEEANKKLEMETVDENRETRLKFKENLVDLEVPPLEFPDSDRTESFTDDDVVDGMSQLQGDNAPAHGSEHSHKDGGTGEEPKDAKVLVEKDGKFELVNLRDIENQCSLPPISNNKDSSKFSSQSDRLGAVANGDKKNSSINNVNGFTPQPPAGPKVRHNSANLAKSVHKVKPQRRAQSASVSTRFTTFSLSPEQKELQKRILEKQERLRREDEERRKEQEEQKRRENEMVFKNWLQKKNSQLIQEKRIQQAKEMETSSISGYDPVTYNQLSEEILSVENRLGAKEESKEEDRNSHQAFAAWLKRKHEEKMKEKQMEELQKQEVEAFLLERKNREGAFDQWLRQKRIQKRSEEQAAKERSRRLLLEARRNKQIHDLFYIISDSKFCCYMDR